MRSEPVTYPGYRFPAEIISHAVWLYHVFSLSLRDRELILAERGITVTQESIRCWCRKFGAEFAVKLRRRRPKPSDIWYLDKVFSGHQWRAALPLAGRRSARRGARHPGAGSAERHGSEALLQAPARRPEVQPTIFMLTAL